MPVYAFYVGTPIALSPPLAPRLLPSDCSEVPRSPCRLLLPARSMRRSLCTDIPAAVAVAVAVVVSCLVPAVVVSCLVPPMDASLERSSVFPADPPLYPSSTLATPSFLLLSLMRGWNRGRPSRPNPSLSYILVLRAASRSARSAASRCKRPPAAIESPGPDPGPPSLAQDGREREPMRPAPAGSNAEAPLLLPPRDLLPEVRGTARALTAASSSLRLAAALRCCSCARPYRRSPADCC